MKRESKQGTASREETDPRYVWLTVRDVSRRYGMSEQWVYRCQDLRQYAKRFGHKLMFRLSDIHRFEEGRQSVTRGYSTHLLMRPEARAILNDKPVPALKFDME